MTLPARTTAACAPPSALCDSLKRIPDIDVRGNLIYRGVFAILLPRREDYYPKPGGWRPW